MSSGRSAFSSRSRSCSRFGLFAALLAQLLLDGAHLLAQQVIPLLLGHFAARFGGDLVAQFQHLHFMRQIAMHHPQSFGPRGRFEQRLALFGIQAEHRREHERQPQRIFVGRKQAAQFLRSVGLRERQAPRPPARPARLAAPQSPGLCLPARAAEHARPSETARTHPA